MNIVLAPGYMLDRDLWTEVAAGLESVGAPWHADLTRDTTIEAMARRLVDEAPRPFVAIGFSMGGYVVREAARQAPDQVLGLVQIATSSRGDTDIQRRRKAALQGSHSRFTGLSRAAMVSSLAPAHATDAVITRIQEMGERLGGEVFQRQSRLVRIADTDRLGEIDCPTLIIAAGEDRLRSLSEAEELHAGIRGSTLRVIPGSGHMIPIEAPDALLSLLLPWLSALRVDAPNVGRG